MRFLHRGANYLVLLPQIPVGVGMRCPIFLNAPIEHLVLFSFEITECEAIKHDNCIAEINETRGN